MARFGRGLFVAKPSCDVAYQRRGVCGLRQTVRGCPLTSAVGRGDCHSLRHPIAVRARMAVGLARSVYALRGGLRSSTAVRHRYLGQVRLLLLAADPARIQARPGSLLALALVGSSL
jgi:hypothetical protein